MLLWAGLPDDGALARPIVAAPLGLALARALRGRRALRDHYQLAPIMRPLGRDDLPAWLAQLIQVHFNLFRLGAPHNLEEYCVHVHRHSVFRQGYNPING